MKDMEEVECSSSGMVGTRRRQGRSRSRRRSRKRRLSLRSCENRGSSSCSSRKVRGRHGYGCVPARQEFPSSHSGWPYEHQLDLQSEVAAAQEFSEACMSSEQVDEKLEDTALGVVTDGQGYGTEQDVGDGGLLLLPPILDFCNSHALLRMGSVRKSWAPLAWEAVGRIVMQCVVSVKKNV